MIIKTGIIPRAAFSVFGVDIYWYAIIITCAIAIGFIWARIHDKKFGIKYNDIFDMSIYVIPIAIVCARIYYVVFNMEYYISNPSDILNFRNGGIAIYGALIGAIVTVCIFCKHREINIWDMLDYLAPIIPLCQAIGRWGNYVNVEAYGTETNGCIRMEIVQDGIIKYVHPTFLYESIGNVILFFLLYFLFKRRKLSGSITCAYLVGYAVIRFFVEGLRTDSLMLGNVRVSQMLSVIIIIAGLSVYIYRKCKCLGNNVKKCRKMSYEKWGKIAEKRSFCLT